MLLLFIVGTFYLTFPFVRYFFSIAKYLTFYIILVLFYMSLISKVLEHFHIFIGKHLLQL